METSAPVEETYRVSRADLDRWVADGLLTEAGRDRLLAELTLPPPPPRVVKQQRKACAVFPAWVRSAALTALTLMWLGLFVVVALIAGPRLSRFGPAAAVAVAWMAAAGLVLAGGLLRRVAPARDVMLAAAIPVCAFAAWGVLTFAEVVPSARAVPNFSVGRFSTLQEEAGVQWGANAAQRRAVAEAQQGWRIGIEGAATLVAVGLVLRTQSRAAVVVACALGWFAAGELLARLDGVSPAAFWLADGRGPLFALGGAALVLAAAVTGWRVARRGRVALA